MRSKRTVWMLLLALSVPPACTSSPVYYAEAIEARVVDAETKQPIVGVVVTANWELEKGTLGGNVPVSQLVVMEAVSGQDGKFILPAWGSKLALLGHLVNKDPQLLLFKSGYEYRRLLNEFTVPYNQGPHRRSDWNGKTIELKPFRGKTEEYARDFQELNYDLRHVITGRPEECNWKKLPRTVRAMAKEKERLAIDICINNVLSFRQEVSHETCRKPRGVATTARARHRLA